ncbi:hypothetical protein EVAR_88961_1 [Eumeta japonica]|uniref:Uncharacterized protein n=1 Tax=Eumeta variegata TaxID=151549 RepID=A0A4C1VQU9_EUMVA|nr:hypothetical protein EVAR_88961_1 [Eumeta japonica]
MRYAISALPEPFFPAFLFYAIATDFTAAELRALHCTLPPAANEIEAVNRHFNLRGAASKSGVVGGRPTVASAGCEPIDTE